jgi:hypothetical protein
MIFFRADLLNDRLVLLRSPLCVQNVNEQSKRTRHFVLAISIQQYKVRRDQVMA